MKLSPPSLVRGWRAALLLVAGPLFTPGKASAECGDYVTIRNAPANSGRQHTLPANPDHPADQVPVPAKSPCHGPNCSGAPDREPPPMTPAPTTGPHPKQPARLLDRAADTDPEPDFAFDRKTTSANPISRAEPIFHPPRHG